MASSCLLVLVLALRLLGVANSDVASDRAECENQLIGLAPCLNYVRGGAKAPTPDCCTGMKEVVTHSFKCLCVLVRDRDAPELGLKVNANLALTLPSKCQAPANISDCPRLLGLAPNSSEAKVFEQFGKELQSPAASANVAGNSTGIKGTSALPSGGRSKRWLGMQMDCGVSILFLVLHVLLLLLDG